MKKNVITNAIVAVVFSGMAYASAANAADGTINFTGNITASACTVDSSSASQTVSLGTVSSSAFSAAGATASPTKFTINLTKCPDTVSTAAVKFDGTSDSTNTDLLALTSASTAGAVGIGIYESDSSTIIPLHTQSAAKTLDTASTSTVNSLEYIAKYVSTAAAVTAGSANATTDFTIVYN